MQHLKKIFFFLLVAAACLPHQAFASHAMGSDISYQCLGGNTYRITLQFYRDCSGIEALTTVSVTYSSVSCGFAETTIALSLNNTTEASPICNAQLPLSKCNDPSGPFPGVELYTYSGTITLPMACPDWLIGFRECCRNPGITNLVNPQNFNLYVNATINNTNGLCDNSPVFTSPPVPYICAGMPYSYNHGAVDYDGDSLVYELVQPLHDNSVNIAYVPGLAPNQPLSTNGAFLFNPTTGQISFTPTTTPQSAVISVRVTSYRNGVVVGITMRDIQMTLLSAFLCSNQSPAIGPIRNITGASLIDSSYLQLCSGSALSFDIPVTDVNGDSILLTSNNQSAIPGSVFSVIGAGTAVTGRFTWTPSASAVGLYPFQITYKDNGCPVSSPQTMTYVLRVFDKVSAGDDQVYCGEPLQLQAVGGSYFVWSPATGLSDDSISNPIATVSVPTYYTVSSDCGVDSVFVDVKPGFTLDAGKDTSICLHGIAHFTPALSAGGAPYTYNWSPAAGLSATNTANVFASPDFSTTYTLQATSALGCVKKDSVSVTIAGISPAVLIQASKDTVCVGEQVQLNLITTPTTCGITSLACSGQPAVYSAGAGTSSTGIGTPYEGYWEDGRVQYLYRASELHTLGFSGGTITGIAFNVSDKKSTSPYNDFTIRMGCTGVNELNTFISGLQVVKSPASYITVTGWNHHSFTSGYDWDGVSNLVIEICFNNSLSTDDDDVAFTPTLFNSVAYDFADDPNGGCALIYATHGRNRPNIQLTACNKPVNNALVGWAPAGSLSNASIANPVAQLFGTTTFTASYNAGACKGMDVLTIVVDSTVYVETVSDTSFCSQTTAQLGATVFGTPGGYSQLNCGANGTACGPASDTLIIGSGATPSNLGSPFRGDFQDTKAQYLYTAAEITAMGGADCILKEIGFEITFKSSTGPFRDFTIHMGCTNLTSFSGSSFSTGLTQVFGPTDVTTVSGWTTFTLQTPYEWDGVSNLIVQVCFNNTGYAGSDIVNCTTMPNDMAIYQHTDFAAGCLLASGILSKVRPNIRFGFCYPPLNTAFSYSWSPATGLSNPNIINPTAQPDTTTQYTLTVRGGVCDVADNVTISVGLDVNIFQENPVCNGSNTAIVVAQPEVGIPPYTFRWNTGITVAGRLTDTLFNLGPGIYSVTVTDASACVDTGFITITAQAPLQAAFNRLLNCSGDSTGSVIALITGGTPPYNFTWSNSTLSFAQLTDTIQNLAAGTYSVTVNDWTGCSKVFSTTLSPSSNMVITPTIQNPDCYDDNNGAVNISVAGGQPPYRYQWSTGQTTPGLSGLAHGGYFLTVTDFLNCTEVYSLHIVEPDEMLIDTIYVSDAGCNQCSNGGISIAASGGTPPYAYSVDNVNYQSDSTFNALSPNVYGVYVRDANGCILSSFAQVDFYNGIVSHGEQASLTVYPNPAQNFITVAMQLKSARKVELSIKSIVGKEAYAKTFAAQQSLEERINTEEYAAGVYFVVVKIDGSVLYKKLVVE